MIINGASRKNGAFFARHLLRADHNERVQLVEMRGLGAETVPDAFQEMKAVASGTRCQNYFYHANLNTRADEQLTPEQWAQAVDTLESELQLTGQPRFVIEHEKEGRTHRHVVWSRIDADTMTAIPDSLNYQKHERASRAIEEAFGHQAVPSVLVPDRETPRPERNPQDWETFRGQETRIDPKAVRAEVTQLWQHADSGAAFAAALHEHGYILARGDRRDFCIIDQAGDEHSLARRISGAKAAEIRARMEGIDREGLPSVEEGRALARQRQGDPETEGASGAPQEAPTDAPTAAVQASPSQTPEAPKPALSTFDAVMAETVGEAEAEIRHSEAAEAAEAKGDAPGGRFEQWRTWWGNMREYVSHGWGEMQQRVSHYFNRGEPDDTPAPPQHTGPEL